MERKRTNYIQLFKDLKNNQIREIIRNEKVYISCHITKINEKRKK